MTNNIVSWQVMINGFEMLSNFLNKNVSILRSKLVSQTINHQDWKRKSLNSKYSRMKLQYRTPTNYSTILETSVEILFIISNSKPIYQKQKPLCIISRIEYRQHGNQIRVIEVQYKFTSYRATRNSNTSSFIVFFWEFWAKIIASEKQDDTEQQKWAYS